MTARISTDTRMRVVLDAVSPRGALAAGALAAEAGLSLADAASRLADAPCELCPTTDPQTAQRLVRVLSLYGLRVRSEPAEGPWQRRPVRFDAALQWALAGPCAPVAEAVATRIGLSARDIAERLATPPGLILADLDWATVDAWRQVLRGVPGLRLVVSDPEAALYDLLPAGRAAESGQAVALLLHLRRLGIAPCPVTGAVGAGLDRAMRDHVMRRFPRAGFVPVNRDFQRFDLLLTGVSGLDADDLDGFLRARGRIGAGGSADPLRIECALGRADALAFQSDYAAIGIHTRLRLVWRHAARMS